MGAWKIGRFFGIDLYIHWTFVLLPLFAVWNRPDDSPVSPAFIVAVICGLFTCVVLHEYGHALMARRFGIKTRDITLYPIGGVARLERISEKPLEELCIAVAGPAVNVVIAILLGCVLVPLLFIRPELLQKPVSDNYLFWLLAGNIVLVVFNMIPAFPMDGGRVFRALLSMCVGHLTATRVAAGVGMVLAIIGGGFFLLSSNYLAAVMAFFILMAGQQELRYVEWKYEQRRLGEEEPLPVVPAVSHPYYQSQTPPPAQAFGPSNGFLFQPRVAVYVWDNANGIWVKEGAMPRPPRLSEN